MNEMVSVFGIVDKHWKRLMWLPLLALAVSAVVLANTALSTGFILERDVELTGGKQITVPVGSADISLIEKSIPGSKVQLTSGITKTLQVSVPYAADETETVAMLKKLVEFEGEPTVRSIGPVLGEIFFRQALIAFAAAFILMSIVVFAIFRSAVPSGIVILSVVVDIGVTLGIMNVMGIEMSLPVLAALLMLIGYSVDTDILLTTNMLRSRELPMLDRIRNGMKTGLLMTITAIAALLSLYLVTGSFVLERIALVLIIGLCVDVFATWFTNVGILRWHMERRQ